MDDGFAGKGILFDVSTPLTKAAVARQVEQNMKRGLPEIDGAALRTIHIVANGPSAKAFDFSTPGTTMALNGGINLFPEDGPPDFWAACDPQELVASFLRNPSKETTFIVASKCHPAVFERLQGFDVRLWHINDQPIPLVRKVPCAVSVTLCAMMLAQRLGYRDINVYGLDACFGADGSHHASGEGGPPMPGEVDVDVGGLHFKTTATWGAEAQDAINIIPVLEWCGAEVTIHGDGMIAAIRRELKSAA